MNGAQFYDEQSDKVAGFGDLEKEWRGEREIMRWREKEGRRDDEMRALRPSVPLSLRPSVRPGLIP
jgi:hypothetical protein